MENSNANKLPTQKVTLGNDENGDPATEWWNYALIVGMLLYQISNEIINCNERETYPCQPRCRCIAQSPLKQWLMR